MSPSQAPLCHCTLRTVTDRPEGTLRSLRYAFGGDHPSQTTHQAMSSQQELELKQTKGRISYTIRAGRNLPDKEFRYLRTVIVTAAVYWGFNSRLLVR